ncbi:MAG: 1-deoxy-D-xylulose-5-phosphate synthase [Aminivibrio sp.]|jgi:1-deoxy-D-xylulose-5-phosphate synthase
MEILETLKDYSEIKNLSGGEIKTLASELRHKITSVALKNGGHLASSLGAVELTISLLRSFDPASDRVIFDVGHQAYAYKLLTGRLENFHTLRQWGGVSGFPKRGESPFDHFDTGHSSTSLSAALGYAKARDVLGEKRHVVAVIGDASLLNGLAFEALNYTRESGTRVIYILNDNAMSISPRVGGMATHLARLSSSSAYNWLKKAIKDSCASLPRGQAIENVLGKVKDHIKTIVKPINIFDEMDINYWGPFDGHNVEEMEHVFELAKKYDGPVLIHAVTVKGKGFEEAEKDPTAFHGLSPAEPAGRAAGKSWSSAAAEVVLEMAKKDPKVVCLTAAMKSGSRLEEFAGCFPDRFFDVGIAEGHMVTMAAGMAAGGLKPVVFIYSTFMQRAMDQLVHDVCMQNLPVTFAVDRAGFVGEDGETHQGLLDISWCRPVPNLLMTAPRDLDSMVKLFNFTSGYNGPVMIRFPRGKVPARITSDLPPETCGRMPGPEIIKNGEEKALIGYGRTVELMIRARERAAMAGIHPLPAVIDLVRLKPLPETELKDILSPYSEIVIAEDGYAAGGAGEAVAAFARELDEEDRPSVTVLGVPDIFVPQGRVEEQEIYCGITPEKVVSALVPAQKTANRQSARL